MDDEIQKETRVDKEKADKQKKELKALKLELESKLKNNVLPKSPFSSNKVK